MTTTSTGPRPYPLRHELDALLGNWIWYLVLGICLIVIGVIALGAPLISTLTSVTFFSVLLIMGGIAQMLGAFGARQWSGFFAFLLMGILYLAVGILSMAHPLEAAAGLTLLIACFLIVGGTFRIVAALSLRFPHWGWQLANGVVTLLLGIVIWRMWPAASLWVIGTFLGIELIFNGATWVAFALAIRAFSRPAV